MESLLALSGLDWPVPDYTTFCRRQKHIKVQIPYRAASGPLHLLVDSTGIKFSGEGEWQVRKHRASRRRQWRKIHIGIDAETLGVRAVEMTSNRIGDAPVLPGLLAEDLPDLSPYDTVFLGSPVWGEAMPAPQRSFLSTHDLTGEFIAPFITHGGFGPGSPPGRKR